MSDPKRSLVVAVLWYDGDENEAADAVTAALKGLAAKGVPGGVGSYRQDQVDRKMIRDIERVGIDFGQLFDGTEL